MSADTPLELTSDGDELLVSPIHSKPRQRDLRASLEKISRKFGGHLKRLSVWEVGAAVSLGEIPTLGRTLRQTPS